MRTTLDIDDDVLFAAKELAAKERTSAGKIMSEFFRRGVAAGRAPSPVAAGQPFVLKNGIPLFPSRGELVTNEHVQQLFIKIPD